MARAPSPRQLWGAAMYGSLSERQYTNAEVMAELGRAGQFSRRSQVLPPDVNMSLPYSSYDTARDAAASAAFDAIDRNHDGSISREEFERFQRSGGVATVFGSSQAAVPIQTIPGPPASVQYAAPSQYIQTVQCAAPVQTLQYSAAAPVKTVQCATPPVVTSPCASPRATMKYVTPPVACETAYVAPARCVGTVAYTPPAPPSYQVQTQVMEQPVKDAAVDPYGPGGIFEGAIEVFNRGEKHILQEAVVDARQQVISGVRPIYTFEKVVEVPQVVVKEFEREVIKPQLIERIIEVPKTEIVEKQVVLPPTVEVREQVVEVPQVHVEERVIHVPKKEIQERLIEIPKVEYVERIEYDDYVEYREVPVDKIVEVPEIEYHIREVEHLVPQTYIQEYYIDRYTEVPVTQVQEVQRQERVPMAGSYQSAQAASQYIQTQTEAMRQVAEANGTEAYGSILYGAPMDGSVFSADAQGQQSQQQQYAQQASNGYLDYDPNSPANNYGYGSSYGCGGYNPFTSNPETSEAAKDAIQATIASLPVGFQIAVPKGTIRPGHAGTMTPPGSMAIPPGYAMSGSYPPGSMPMPMGSMPPLPPGSMPPGGSMAAYPPLGSMSGSMAPGTMLPGSMPMPGQPDSMSIPPGTMLGSMPPGSFPGGAFPGGSMPGGSMAFPPGTGGSMAFPPGTGGSMAFPPGTGGSMSFPPGTMPPGPPVSTQVYNSSTGPLGSMQYGSMLPPYGADNMPQTTGPPDLMGSMPGSTPGSMAVPAY